MTEELTDEGRFATRRRTEIEHDRRRIDVLFEGLLNEHRTGLLHVVTTGMEKRVERELRALGKVVAVDMPRHLVGVAFESQYVEFGIEAYRRHGRRFQRP